MQDNSLFVSYMNSKKSNTRTGRSEQYNIKNLQWLQFHIKWGRQQQVDRNECIIKICGSYNFILSRGNLLETSNCAMEPHDQARYKNC